MFPSLEPVVVRLRSVGFAGSKFTEVGTAAELATVREDHIKPPACYVIEQPDTVAGGAISGTLSIILVVSNRTDRIGAAALDNARNARSAVFYALNDFEFADGWSALEYNGSRMTDFDSGKMVYDMAFTYSGSIEPEALTGTDLIDFNELSITDKVLST